MLLTVNGRPGTLIVPAVRGYSFAPGPRADEWVWATRAVRPSALPVYRTAYADTVSALEAEVTESERSELTEERLRHYRVRMNEHFATPLFCLGVGHAHREGQLVVCVPDGVPLEAVYNLLRQAVDHIGEALRK